MRCMTRPGLRIGLFFFLAMGLSLNASAERRAHRPWLMIHSKSKPAPVIDTPFVRVRTTPESKLSLTENRTGNAIANQALLYKGTRYRFGGTTKRGMDCSGLVNRIYADLKLKNLPRAAHGLYKK